MPYDVYLHSSFDSQLQPLPGTIIDWQPTQSMVRSVRSASSHAPLLCGETRVTPWRVPLRYNTEPSSPARSLGLSDRMMSSITQCGSALLASSEAPRLVSQAVDHTATLTSGAGPAATAASGGGTVTQGQDLAGRIAQDVAMVQAEAAVGGPSAATTLRGPTSARVEGRLAAGSVVDRAGNSNATGETVSSLPAVIPVTRASPANVSDSTSTATMTSNSNISNKSSAVAVVKDAAGSASAIGPTGSDVVGSTLHVNGRVAQAVQRDGTMVVAAAAPVAPSHLVISVPDAPGISRDASNVVVAGPSTAGEVTASPLVVSTSPSTTTTTTTTTLTPLSTASRSPTLQLPCGRQEHGAEFIYGSYGEVQVYQKESFICTAGLSALFGLSQVTRRYMRPVPEVQAEAMRLIQATESNSHTSVTPHESSPKLLTSSDEAQSQDKQLLLVGEVRQRCGLKVSEVAQLAWYWGRLHWSGVLNVRFLPWSGRQTASGAEGGKAARTPWLPVCEYVMRTPWTMWAVQRDASVTKVAGFLTLYQTTPRHTSNNVSSDSNGAVVGVSSSKSATDKNDAEASTSKDSKAHSEKAVVERGSIAKSGGDESSSSSAVSSSHEAADKTPAQGKTQNKKSAPVIVVAEQAPPVATSSSSTKIEQKNGKAVSEPSSNERHNDSVKAKHKAETEEHSMNKMPKDSETHLGNQASSSDTLIPRMSTATLPWWRLRALRIGAGVAAKNDLARGINLYWGCSAEMGNGLCVATHIDVLRRLCCSFVSARGALTLAVRLRVNLITYSGTALDAGLMYVPCAALPHTTLRLTSSAAGQTIGLQVEDITHDWGAAWLARHRAWSSANASDSSTTSSKEVQVVQEERNAAVANEVEGRWFSLWTWWPTMPWSGSTTTTTSVGSTSHSGHGKDNAIALHDKAGQTNMHAAAVEPDTTPSVLSAAHARALMQRWLPPVTTSRWWPRRAIDLTRRTQATATTQVRETWRLVRRLDWLERCLDKAHVDVTVGVAHDPVRHGTGWGTFLILTAH